MMVKAFSFTEVLDLMFPPIEISSREAPSDDEVRPLMIQIGSVGLLNNPTLFSKEGSIFIGDGHRRFSALKLAIKENYRPILDRYPDNTMSFQIAEKSDAEMLRAQIVGNTQIKQQVNSESARALYRYLIQVPGMTKERLAEETGFTVAKINNILKLNNLSDAAKTLLDSGNIELTNAIALANVPKSLVNDELLQDAVNKNTTDFAGIINTKLDEVRAERRANQLGSHKKEFVAEKKLRTKESLNELFIKAETAFALEESVENRIRFEVFKEIFQLDDLSIQKAKEDFDTQVKKSEDLRIQRAKERDAKKIEDARKLVEEANKATASA